MAEYEQSTSLDSPMRSLLMHNNRMQQHGRNFVGEKLNQHSHNDVNLFVRRDILAGRLNTRHATMFDYDLEGVRVSSSNMFIMRRPPVLQWFLYLSPF